MTNSNVDDLKVRNQLIGLVKDLANELTNADEDSGLDGFRSSSFPPVAKGDFWTIHCPAMIDGINISLHVDTETMQVIGEHLGFSHSEHYDNDYLADLS